MDTIFVYIFSSKWYLIGMASNRDYQEVKNIVKLFVIVKSNGNKEI